MRRADAAANSERLAREHAEQRAEEERRRLAAATDSERDVLQQQIRLAEEKRQAVSRGPVVRRCPGHGLNALPPTGRSLLRSCSHPVLR